MSGKTGNDPLMPVQTHLQHQHPQLKNIFLFYFILVHFHFLH